MSTKEFSYSRCMNPFRIPKHNKRTDLRKPSEAAKKRFPHLKSHHYLCTGCRKRIANISKTTCNNVVEPEPIVYGKYFSTLYI